MSLFSLKKISFIFGFAFTFLQYSAIESSQYVKLAQLAAKVLTKVASEISKSQKEKLPLLVGLLLSNKNTPLNNQIILDQLSLDADGIADAQNDLLLSTYTNEMLDVLEKNIDEVALLIIKIKTQEIEKSPYKDLVKPDFEIKQKDLEATKNTFDSLKRAITEQKLTQQGKRHSQSGTFHLPRGIQEQQDQFRRELHQGQKRVDGFFRGAAQIVVSSYHIIRLLVKSLQSAQMTIDEQQKLNETIKKLCLTNSQFKQIYEQAKKISIVTLTEIFDKKLSSLERLEALLRANNHYMAGTHGDELKKATETINGLIFDQSGNLKPNAMAILDSNNAELFKFFRSISKSKSQYLQHLRLARSYFSISEIKKIIKQAKKETFKPSGESLIYKYWQYYAPRFIAQYGKIRQEQIIHNSQNQRLLKFITLYQSVQNNEALSFEDSLAELSALKDQSTGEYKKYMENWYTDLINQLKKDNILLCCPFPPQPSDKLPEVSLPRTPEGNQDLPDYKPAELPCGLGLQPQQEVAQPSTDCLPDLTQHEPRPCNHSLNGNLPSFQPEPQSGNLNPQPQENQQEQQRTATPQRKNKGKARVRPRENEIAQVEPLTEEEKQQKIDEIRAEIQEALASKLLELEIERNNELIQIQQNTILDEDQKREKIIQTNQQLASSSEKEKQKSQNIIDDLQKKKKLYSQLIDQYRNDSFALELIKKIIKLDTASLNSAIGDLEKLPIMIQRVLNIPGALQKDGCLDRIFTLGKITIDDGRTQRARGGFTELDVICELLDLGYKILHINYKAKLGHEIVELDIVTDRLVIEVKGGQWLELRDITNLENIAHLSEEEQNKINKMINKFKSQKIVSRDQLKKRFIVYSKKREVPSCLKDFFENNNIEHKELQFKQSKCSVL